MLAKPPFCRAACALHGATGWPRAVDGFAIGNVEFRCNGTDTKQGMCAADNTCRLTLADSSVLGATGGTVRHWSAPYAGRHSTGIVPPKVFAAAGRLRPAVVRSKDHRDVRTPEAVPSRVPKHAVAAHACAPAY